jgi:hypothetical protein
MPNAEPLNTLPIQQFISQVKSADAGQSREVKMTMQQAKKLAFTLGEVMTRLNGDLEKLLIQQASGENDLIQINMDAGTSWK